MSDPKEQKPTVPVAVTAFTWGAGGSRQPSIAQNNVDAELKNPVQGAPSADQPMESPGLN